MLNEKDLLLDNAIKSKNAIYHKLKETKRLLKETSDPTVRIVQSERFRILNGMYKDALDEVKRLRGGAIPSPKKTSVSFGVVVESKGLVWADIEGHTWDVLGDCLTKKATNQSRSRVDNLVQTAFSKLSDLQQLYLTEYYVNKLNKVQIAKKYGKNKSTITYTINRAKKNLEKNIVAYLILNHLINSNEVTLDLFLWAQSCEIFSERQKEMIYLLLTKEVTMKNIGEYLELHRSTVSRSHERISRKISGVGKELIGRKRLKYVDKSAWIDGSEKDLAASIGMAPGAYYYFVNKDKGRYIDGVYFNGLRVEILKRIKEGQPNKQIIGELKCSDCIVRKVRKMCKNIDLSNINFDNNDYDYHKPDIPSFNIQSLIREFISSENENDKTIGERIPYQVYKKMLAIAYNS